MIRASFLTLFLFFFTISFSQFSSEQIIENCQDCFPRDMFSADLDGDGDLDVLSTFLREDKVAWYENDGAGNFSNQKIISESADAVQGVYATDLDGDGDMDVLSASSGDHKIAWYENDGAGNFSNQKIIIIEEIGVNRVHAADLDGDGDMDILSASWHDNKVAWYENDGAGNFSDQKIISNQTIGAIDVYTADLDADGNIDVLSVSFEDKKIAWYKNDEAGNFSDQKIISTLASRPSQVYVADLDADGDLDVISNSERRDAKIVWHENDGIGNFSDQKIINSTSLGRPSIYVADLDEDEDFDVLSASRYANRVTWYENDGAGNFSTQKNISTQANDDPVVYIGPTIVHVADLDADGDLDILSTSASNNDEKVVWYENLLEMTTSIDYSSIGNLVSISPNPFKDFFTIAIKTVKFSNLPNLSLVDVMGQQVQSVILKDATQQISTAHLAHGLYFYQVINADGQMITNGKIIKH